MILTNGYYVSDLIERKEPHAGNMIVNRYYVFYVFKPDGTYVDYVKHENDYLTFKEIEKRLENSNELYKIESGKLKITSLRGTKFEVEQTLKIIDSNTISDKDIEHHFHPWPDSEGDSEIE